MAGERSISTERNRGTLGVAAAAATFAACVATALATGGPPPAQGPGAARPAPPTAAQADRWGRRFLEHGSAAKPVPAPPAAKRGSRTLFPQNRVLTLYGAAGGFGVLGRKSLRGAAKKLRKQLKPYRNLSHKPVIGGFDLVAVIATSCQNRRDKCRTRVSDKVIRRYLKKIRGMNGRLVLDIQPARSNVISEISHLRNFIREPDVDVAIDAEWNVGKHGTPGQTQGSISAKKLNKASLEIQSIIRNQDLPQKLMIVHQFRKGSISKDGKVKRRDDVDVTFNFDGIGSPSAKKAGYRQLSRPRLFNGFSLFYKLDDEMMRPKGVLKLDPKPDYVMYQ